MQWLMKRDKKKYNVFCIGQYEFLWTLEINIHLSLKASVNIVFKVHKDSHWPQQKTIIVYNGPVNAIMDRSIMAFFKKSMIANKIV
jgi:hypothetical protein